MFHASGPPVTPAAPATKRPCRRYSVALIIALYAWVAIGCLYWLLVAVLVRKTLRVVPMLADLRAPDPPRWPKLSIIVPARDEADTLEAAMAAKLAEGYPNLELVLVDDRSTDGTSAIVDRIAASDPRVRALHLTELPAGWLGKVHALQKGVEASSGELFLFTDADVHFAPGLLTRAVAHLEARSIDFLTVLPAFVAGSFLTDVAVAVMIRIVCMGARAWAIDDPKSSAFGGAGAFNLVRRSALERTPGFEWLRLEVADDLGFGLMLKRSGARIALVNGRGLVSVQWFSTLRGYANGAARAGFACIGRCSVTRTTLVTLLGFALEASPFVALGLVGHPILQLAGLAGSVVALGSAVVAARSLAQPVGAALALPLGIVLQALVGLRAAVLGAWRGGIVWRDTFYSSAELRAGRRVNLP